MRVLLASVVISSACRPPAHDVTVAPVHVAAAPADAGAARPMTPQGPPVARTVDVVDRSFGLEIADPYRWMEGADNAERDAWLQGQGAYAAKHLAAIPGRDKLYARIRELGLGVSAVFGVQLGGTRVFYAEVPANAQLAKLVVRETDGTTRVLIDPETLGSASEHVSLNAWSASPDGTLVSYVLSRGGGESGELHVLDVKTGNDVGDPIPRVWGESAGAWLPDSKRFFYSQQPVVAAGGDPMQNQLRRLHVVGQAVDRDVVVLGREADASWQLAPEEWPGLWIPTGSPWALVTTGGARSEFRVGVARAKDVDLSGASKTRWRAVAGYSDLVEDALPHDDRLYLLTGKDAPNRKVISVPLANPDLAKARVEIAEDGNATLVTIAGARDALYLVHVVNGLARVSRWPWRGKPTVLALPYEGWAHDLTTRLDRDGVTFQIETWLRPGTYFHYDPRTKKLSATGFGSTTTADVSGLVAEEVEATAPDGTHVPLSILSRRDRAASTPAPAILRGYAAYGVSQTPGFSGPRIAWIERGGVYAVCHGRGGGEKGRRWQDDGSRDKKLVGVRDFTACGDYLVEHGYTSRAQLAATAGSMGGVLLGRALTLRPELFAVVHLAAPIVNPLRMLAGENGANEKGELGDPETEAGYRQIAELDPYAHVTDGTRYPAVIVTLGVHDHRVPPWMGSKLAARLQAASASPRPVLVRVDMDAGHGIGNTRDQGFAETADVWSFFLEQIGDPELAVR